MNAGVGRRVLGVTAAVAMVGLAGGVPSAQPPAGPALSALALQQLADARRATARYHDVEQAEADGYLNIQLYEPGEGHHWVNPALVDGTFDPSRPEILLYAPVPGENRLQLVAVEYLIPLGLSATAPPGFAGPADTWRQDTEGFGFWELTVWIWGHNPDGLFRQHNPRVP